MINVIQTFLKEKEKAGIDAQVKIPASNHNHKARISPGDYNE